MVSLSRFRPRLAAFLTGLSRSALAQSVDPQVCGPVLAALIATMVAGLAIVLVGFGVLTGRIHWRFGAAVIVGCFYLFGAGAIVPGIQVAAALSR